MIQWICYAQIMYERMYILRILVISSSITFEILLSDLINSERNGRLWGEAEAVKRGKKSGKNEFLSGKSQGILFQTKGGHPVNRARN